VTGFVIRKSEPLKSGQIVKSDDAILKHNMEIIEGSRMLCKAILATGKVYRKMTQKEMDDAIEYAENVTVVRI
jgi:hypothetical protein